MKIKIILEKDKQNNIGRSGFQIEGRNKKHLKVYIPKVQSKSTLEELHVMHSCMNVMLYAKHNLKRLKYVLFQLPIMPNVTNEWNVMSKFNTDIANKIGCRIEYKRV